MNILVFLCNNAKMMRIVLTINIKTKKKINASVESVLYGRIDRTTSKQYKTKPIIKGYMKLFQLNRFISTSPDITYSHTLSFHYLDNHHKT